MYEILFDVPPNQNPGAAPGGGFLMLIESYYNFTNQLCTWKSSGTKHGVRHGFKTGGGAKTTIEHES